MDNTKIIEIDDRKFELRKMDAKAALKVAKLIVSKIMPIADAAVASSGFGLNDIRLSSVSKALDAMTDDELDKIIDIALRHCYEVLRAGAVQIYNANGTYGVENIENDPLLVLRLTIESAAWSIGSFFDGDRLKSILAPLLGIFQSAESTSTI
jgi:hypothetical protein